ncbi:hypothetical protein PRJ_2124 [Pseudomonas sp. XWY-1]|nr:hypothetical protein PRJ_2124 [Pseudomonas sp. XWY-1]
MTLFVYAESLALGERHAEACFLFVRETIVNCLRRFLEVRVRTAINFLVAAASQQGH